MRGMLETIGKELAKESAKGILDFIRTHFPSWGREAMKRKFDNVCAGVNDIAEGLAQRGLKVDIQRYFEQELKIPLMLINALGEEEKPPLRDLLKKSSLSISVVILTMTLSIQPSLKSSRL